MGLQNTCTKFIPAFCFYLPSVFMFCFFSYSFYSAQLHQDSSFEIIFLSLTLPLALLSIAVIGFLITHHMSNKVFLFSLFLISLLSKTFWIIKIDSVPLGGDFRIIYDAAISLSNGDYSFMQSEHFSSWIYQLGYAIYQAIIIKIFGEGVLPIKLLNAVYSTGTTALIYLVAKEVYSEFSGRVAALLYSIYLPSITTTSVLTNEHLSTLLFYIGLYLIIIHYPPNRHYDYLAGILFPIANIIRPLGSIVLTSVFMYILIQGTLTGLKANSKIILNRLSKIFLSYYIVYYVLSLLVIDMGITRYPLATNREPYWKFAIGLNHQTAGGYSQEDKDFVLQFPIGEERNRAEKELIKERIKDKKKIFILFKNKFERMWGESAKSTYFAFYGTDYHYLLQTMLNYEGFIHHIIISLCIISILFSIFHKRGIHLLFFFLLFLYVGIHLLIEIQDRYRYFVFPLFCIIAGNGAHIIYKWLQDLNIKIRKNGE